MKLFWTIVLMALVVTGCATRTAKSVRQGPTLAEIESMTQAKVSDSVIVAQIQNSDGRYALTAEQIIALKQASVGDEVIKAMLETARKPEVQTITVYQAPYAYPYYGYWPWWGNYYYASPAPCPAPKPPPPSSPPAHHPRPKK